MKVSQGFNGKLIERLDRLHLRYSRQVGGVSGGVRRSNEKGSSNEFSDFRSYNDGDSLRYVDWNSYARLGKLFIRLYNEEKQTEVVVMVDSSASMDLYGKSYTGGLIGASLCYAALSGGDRAKLCMGNDTITLSSKKELNKLLNFADAAVYDGVFDLSHRVKELPFKEKGRFILISDFMYSLDSVEEALKYLNYKKQDITFVMLTGEEENTPGFSGEVMLKDAETDEKISIEITDDVIEKYTKALKVHRGRLSDLCRKYGAENTEIRADEPVASILAKLLYV